VADARRNGAAQPELMPHMLTFVVVALPFAGLLGPLVWMARSTQHCG
jgi:uncharacterized Tic20 family protein